MQASVCAASCIPEFTCRRRYRFRIILAGVAPGFVAKLKEYRRLPPEERKAARRAGRRRRHDPDEA